MKRKLCIIICLLLSLCTYSQQRVIDATDSIPVATASVFDFDGNVVGYTLADGTLSEIPETAYPITIRCLGYEPLVIAEPKDTAWQMKQCFYDMPELVVVPVDRDVLKQTFYIRKYFSLSNTTDTVTYFVEQMAYRYIPARKGAKTGVSSSIHTSSNRCYSMYKVEDIDSVAYEENSDSYLLTTILTLSDKEIRTHKSFKADSTGYYEKVGKSGVSLVQKQSSGVFTNTEDRLAEKKGHSLSPWPLKAIGMTVEINQLYTTQAFRANNTDTYLPKDLMEASVVMEAEGRGKYLRKALKSQVPVTVRLMLEVYVVDRDFLTKEEAKEESANKTSKMDFVIPSNIPSVNDATRRLIERAKDKAKK